MSFNDDLVEGVREGRWIAYIDPKDGTLRLKHPDDATKSELNGRLSARETSVFLAHDNREELQ